MKVKVLQGVNLKNPYTTIEMTLDAKPKTNLIDKIQSFHPIFMYNYSVDNNTVSIQSKLPHLWKEAAPALNKQATGEWTDEETLEFLLNDLITNQIKSMSTIPVLHGAHNLGYETMQFVISEGIYHDPAYDSNKSQWNRYYKVGVGQQSTITVSAGSSGDPVIANKTQRDKWVTNSFADRLQLPLAKWEVITSEEHIEEIFDKYEKPVVIKPTGLVGGSGVTTNINDIEHAKKAYRYAKERIDLKQRPSWQQRIMIQHQVEGEDYRILVVKGQMEIATKRMPAFIVGDGESSIRVLIEETNKDPRRDLSNPAHILKPIVFDKMLDEFIEEQGRTLEDIPIEDEKVFVRKVASMSQGGITEDFTEQVHPQIKYIVESLASSVHAHVIGVDVICKDISKPLTISNGSFIEMNMMPEAFLNMFPTIGRQYPEVGEAIVSGLLEDIEPTKKIVVLGGSLDEIPELLKSNNIDPENEYVGVYSDSAMYINGELINSELEPWRAIEAIKLNASLSTIVLHYSTLSEIEELGTGFDSIDILIDSLGSGLTPSEQIRKVIN
jgi:cyanophycin synthetase